MAKISNIAFYSILCEYGFCIGTVTDDSAHSKKRRLELWAPSQSSPNTYVPQGDYIDAMNSDLLRIPEDVLSLIGDRWIAQQSVVKYYIDNSSDGVDDWLRCYLLEHDTWTGSKCTAVSSRVIPNQRNSRGTAGSKGHSGSLEINVSSASSSDSTFHDNLSSRTLMSNTNIATSSGRSTLIS
jgi:hypothetical protein